MNASNLLCLEMENVCGLDVLNIQQKMELQFVNNVSSDFLYGKTDVQLVKLIQMIITSFGTIVQAVKLIKMENLGIVKAVCKKQGRIQNLRFYMTIKMNLFKNTMIIYNQLQDISVIMSLLKTATLNLTLLNVKNVIQVTSID